MFTSHDCHYKMTDWTEEAVPRAEVLRLIYQGMYLSSQVIIVLSSSYCLFFCCCSTAKDTLSLQTKCDICIVH